MSARISTGIVPPPVTPPADEPQEPPQRLEVDVVIEDERWLDLGPIEAWITDAVSAVAAHGTDAKGQIAFALDNDAAVARLNHTFRGIDRPTNVLSFPAGKAAGTYLGDIVLARETVIREASALAVPLVHHVQHLAIHGVLHLLGYDHTTPSEAETMEGLETRLLAMLGVADPYAGSEPL